MYAPSRDFRHIISTEPLNIGAAVISISREPISEVMDYWVETGRPKELHGIYSRGIYSAVMKDRYTWCHLYLVGRYPEFIETVTDALEQIWVRMDAKGSIDNPETTDNDNINEISRLYNYLHNGVGRFANRNR